MTSHVTGSRRTLRTCLAMLGAGAVAFGTLAVPAAAAPSIEPLNDPDPSAYVGSSTSQASVTGSAFGSRATGDWFVEFQSLPVSKGGTQSRINTELQGLQAAADNLDIEVTSSYDELWAGAVVSADDAQLSQLREEVDIVAVYPVLLIEAPEKLDFGAEPDMQYANGMTGAGNLQELDVTGKGLTISIIDTGVDIHHPAFGGTPDTTWSAANGNGAKIIGGYDLVGDDFNADPATDAYSPIPEPAENPDDCQGHGTHVAGISAGNDPSTGFLGVAPDADILAYRVFGCDGSTDSEIMLEAMERSALDGADIVNMSIGASFMTWPNYPTAVAADNLVDKGVVVTVSQGNSGEYGIFSGGAPASGKKVIAVASVDNVASEAKALSVEGVEGLIAYSPSSGSPLPPTDNTELEIISYPDDNIIGGVPLEGAEGKVVIVQRGEFSFYEKAIAAQDSGAAGVIIDNNVPGSINATVEGEEEIVIPTVTISMDDGAAIRAAIADAEADAPTLTWTDETLTSEVPTGGLISDFSSYGLAADLSIKPQVSAPGGFIRSAYPLSAADDDGTGYATMSGTSMAAPHVAGAAALLLETNPELTPAEVLTSFQNNADPLPLSIAPDSGFPDMVHRQGAGMINIPRSVINQNVGTVVTPSELSLLDDDEGVAKTRTLTLTNEGPLTSTINAHHISAPSTWGLNEDPFIYGGSEAEVEFSESSITLAPGESKELQVTITAPEDPGAIYSGYILLENGRISNVVPYAGLAGDYETDLEFMLGEDKVTPALGAIMECDRVLESECVAGGLYGFAPAGYEYDMKDANVPLAILEISNAISYMKIEIFEAEEDGSKGAPLNEDYNLIYESNTEVYIPGIQVYGWDGTYRANANSKEAILAPNGAYLMEVTAVKGVGSIDNPDHVETWVSDPFVINAPRPGDGEIDEDVDKGFLLYNDFASPAAHLFQYGVEGDEVFTGDWDGDGRDTLAVRRGHTFYVQNELVGGVAVSEFKYGRAGDEVFAGDWDGDGKDTFGVRRGHTYYVQNKLIGGNAEVEFKYGRAGDEVLAGDWNGDGKDTFTVRRGNVFHVNNQLIGGQADAQYTLGRVTDEVLVGDWDGDGTDSVGLRR